MFGATSNPGTPNMDAVLDVFRVLYDPGAVFARVREKPRILVPYAVIVVAIIGTTLVLQPYTEKALESLRATLPPEQAARMQGGGGVVQALIGTPIFVFLGLLVGAGLLWVTVSLTASEARFKTLLSVLTHSYVTYILYAALGALVLFMRGIESVSSLVDLRPPLGLDLLVPGATGYLGGLLNGINPLSAWGVWLTGTGISITHNTSPTAGIAAAAIAYVVALAIFSVYWVFIPGGS
ncbi:MAG TPA: YIP1 family protein [Gemmatimonadales bacterium]